jgi:hypothetical protein
VVYRLGRLLEGMFGTGCGVVIVVLSSVRRALKLSICVVFDHDVLDSVLCPVLAHASIRHPQQP